jgi:hypothetical protein
MYGALCFFHPQVASLQGLPTELYNDVSTYISTVIEAHTKALAKAGVIGEVSWCMYVGGLHGTVGRACACFMCGQLLEWIVTALHQYEPADGGAEVEEGVSTACDVATAVLEAITKHALPKYYANALVGHIREGLASDDWRHRRSAVCLFALYGDGRPDHMPPLVDEIVPKLMELCRDAAPCVREVVCSSMGNLSPLRCVMHPFGRQLLAMVVTCLVDPDPRVVYGRCVFEMGGWTCG